MMFENTNIAVGVTSKPWYEFLRARSALRAVNFWRPSPTRLGLASGDWLLFRVPAGKENKIAGGGRFVSFDIQTVDLAWKRWEQANGCADKEGFLNLLRALDRSGRDVSRHSLIGCCYLADPWFLPESEWFEAHGWNKASRNPFRKYPSDNPNREALQQRAERAVESSGLGMDEDVMLEHFVMLREKEDRVGQGEFRKQILSIYKQCAITGEKTHPALEAAHIRPYSKHRNHLPSNGLLLRNDIHKLYDDGLVSVTPDNVFHVSPRIRRKYGNGRDYYALKNRKISVPKQEILRPDPKFLQEHYDRRFKKN